MKNIINCIWIVLGLLFANNSIAQDLIAPNWEWVKQADFVTHYSFVPKAFNTKDGSIYTNSLGGITKFNANGVKLWQRPIATGGGGLNFSSFKKNANDDFFISFRNAKSKTYEFGSTIINNPEEKYVTIIVKLDSAANVVFTKAIYNDYSFRSNITVDSDGNIYLMGELSSPITIDGVELKRFYDEGKPHQHQFFAAKFTPTGDLAWFKAIGQSNYIRFKTGLEIFKTTISPDNNNLVVTGYFEGDTLIFGADTIIEKAFNKQVFIASLDSSGNTNWHTITPLERESDINATKFLFDNKSNLILCRNSDKSSFISKRSPKGDYLYNKSFANSIGNSSIGDLTIDEQDNIYVGVSFSGSPLILQNNPKVEIPNTEEFSESDAVLVKLDSAFNLRWYKHILSTGNETFKALTINNNSLYSFGASKTKEAGDSVYFGSFTHRATTRNEEFNFLTKINLCNQTSFPKLEFNNGILEAPSTWKNWTWFVDDEEIEDRNWYTYGPKKSGTYVVGTREENGCFSVTEPFVWYSTGINDINVTDIVINVYPNPANKTFTLKTPELVNSISIYTIGGQLIKNIPTNSKGEYKINIQNSGLYFIKVSSPNGYLTEKVVIW